jgi:hypothetical protein
LFSNCRMSTTRPADSKAKKFSILGTGIQCHTPCWNGIVVDSQWDIIPFP